MNCFLQKSELRDLFDKVVAGQRISEEDALRLFESKDLSATKPEKAKELQAAYDKWNATLVEPRWGAGVGKK